MTASDCQSLSWWLVRPPDLPGSMRGGLSFNCHTSLTPASWQAPTATGALAARSSLCCYAVAAAFPPTQTHPWQWKDLAGNPALYIFQICACCLKSMHSQELNEHRTVFSCLSFVHAITHSFISKYLSCAHHKCKRNSIKISKDVWFDLKIYLGDFG